MNSAKSPSNAELKTAQSPQIRSDGELSIPYLLSALSTADAERREMVELMREAANMVERKNHNCWQNPPFRMCAICGESGPDNDTPAHTPDCLVTKLRQAADRADGGQT